MDDRMNPEARRIIELTRAARTPSVDDKDRVRRALAITLAATAAAAPGVAAGATAAKAAAAGTAAKTVGALGAATGLKLALSVVVIASLGVGAYWWTRPAPAPVATPVVAPAVKVVAVEPPVAEEPPTAPAEIALETTPSVGSLRDPLLAELALLNRAQQAWRHGAAGKALELAQQHAQRYPRSKLALERDAVRVFALCALGRKHQAHSLAVTIVKRAPRSPLRTSVEESCGMR
jgi:hypothetical protein